MNGARESGWAALVPAACVAAALALAVLPLLGAELPGLIDLPNHVARAAIRERIGDDPFYAAFYRCNPPFIPNAAYDAFAAALSPWLAPPAIARTFTALAVLLPVCGAIALARALGNGSLLVVALAALCAYDYSLAWGFLNYRVGVGLALCGVAVAVRLHDAPVAWRLLVGALLTLAAFYCHALALLPYAVLVAGIEFDRGRRDAASVRRTAARVALALAPLAVPVATFLLKSPTAGELTSVGALDPAKGLRACAKALHAGIGVPDYLHLGLLALLAVLLLCCGRVRIVAGMHLPLALLAVACLSCPDESSEASCLQERLPTMLVFALTAALGWQPRRRAGSVAVAVLVAGGLVLRTTTLGDAYRERGRILADAQAALAAVPEGALLFTCTGPLADADHWQKYRAPVLHAACLRALSGRVFLPQLLVSALHHTVAPANETVAACVHQWNTAHGATTPEELRARVRTLAGVYRAGMGAEECPELPGGTFVVAVHFPADFAFPHDLLEPVVATPHVRVFAVRD